MEEKERELLGHFGIKDPYAERRMEDKA